ncbi:chemotaxis protein CheW [Marinobacterium jannaschii]|uniref:chemotaxis protein CheW n=1 Tax=Marinobacterium jannaschii TaxID=64970 RepID=UPI0004854B5B|nr:chemotaxis protein CheW [Marinobacterium jannaschii]
MESSSQATAVSDVSAKDVRHGFRIGSDLLLIPLDTHSELAPLPRLCAIPDTPDWFAGFINHRGDTVPAYDLYRLFDKPVQEKRWVLILGLQSEAVALLLDDYPKGIVDLQASEISETTLSNAIAPFCRGYLSSGDDIWAEFDYKSFFRNLKQKI